MWIKPNNRKSKKALKKELKRALRKFQYDIVAGKLRPVPETKENNL